MARRVTNVVRGRSLEVRGLRELAQKVDRLGSAMASAEAAQVVSDAASDGREKIRASMRSAGWPSGLVEKAFSTAAEPNRRGKITALMGVNKRSNMVTWTAAGRSYMPDRKRVERKVEANGSNKVAMSLVAMFEFGTTRMRARPAVRSAMAAATSPMRQRVADGFRGIVERNAK